MFGQTPFKAAHTAHKGRSFNKSKSKSRLSRPPKSMWEPVRVEDGTLIEWASSKNTCSDTWGEADMLDNQTDSDGLTIAPLHLDLPKPCEHRQTPAIGIRKPAKGTEITTVIFQKSNRRKWIIICSTLICCHLIASNEKLSEEMGQR
jgi:hypothetical protein